LYCLAFVKSSVISLFKHTICLFFSISMPYNSSTRSLPTAPVSFKSPRFSVSSSHLSMALRSRVFYSTN
jgi:hypothetical protein